MTAFIPYRGTGVFFRRALRAAAFALLSALPLECSASWSPLTDPALAAYWKFDETAGTTAADASSNAINATVYGASWSAAGKAAGAMDFDATDYVEMPDSAPLNSTGTITVSAWVKYRTIDYAESGPVVFCKGGSYCLRIGGPFSSTSKLAAYVSGTLPEGWVYGNTNLSPNVWYHVAFTYDGSSVTLYLNGQPDKAVAATGAIVPISTKGNAGWAPTAVDGYRGPLDGYLDELAVYSRALTPEEMAQFYGSYVEPVAVSTLSAAPGQYVGSLVVAWPAPRNDTDGGALAAGSTYYVQYSTFPSVVWSTASAQVVQSTSGVTPSNMVNCVLGGLDPGATYYAAVWHRDEGGNLSAVSNIASGYAKPFPGGTFTRNVLGADTWELRFNSYNAGDDSAEGISFDAAGNIYVANRVYNGANLDLALHKLAPDGTLLLEKYYNGPANGNEYGQAFSAVDKSDGSFYLVGEEWGTPRAGIILKYAADGSRLWTKRIVGSGSSAAQGLSRISLDDAGNIYVSGTFTNASNNADQFVGKYDRNGNLLWTNLNNTTVNTEAANAIVIVGTSVYSSGYADRADLGQSNNGYIRKMSADGGVTQWTYVFNSTYSRADSFIEVAADQAGNLYFGGEQGNTSISDMNFLVQKRSPEGTELWTRFYSFSSGYSENIYGMAFGADGYLYLGGWSQVSASKVDVKVARVSTAGDLAGTFTFNSAGGGDYTRALISSGTYLFLTAQVKEGGNLNSYVRKLSPSDFSLPPPAVTPFAASVSSYSINWAWNASSGQDGYALNASSGGPLSGNLAAAAAGWTENGLLPNAPYSRTLTVFNVYGSSVSVPVTRYTRAQVPSGLTVSAVYVTSAALTWSTGVNPAGTVSQLERSTGGIYAQVVYAGSATVALASGLQFCTTYDFAVKALNGDGLGSEYSTVASTRTKDHQALPPSGLSAEPLPGGKISLNWAPSPSPHAALYRLYYDAGTGAVNYTAPLAELQSSATSYVTGVLASSAAYTFALRAVNRCGVEETNTHVLASAASVPALSTVKASIKEPHSGKKVSGNRLTVIAEITQGDAHQVDKVLFQYRPEGGAWAAITPANANHPNPDLEAPYFVHWDVSALAAGNYDLRAVAYDVYGTSDTAPAAINVRVDNADFEVKETLQGDGKVKKEQLITNTITSVVSSADSEKAWVTKVAVPSGAVSVATVTLSIVNNPVAAPPASAELNPVGQATEIELSNGQHLLDNGQTAEVILTYPDDDGDGVVDGSFIRAERLKIYSFDSAAGAWKADLACRVDKEKRQVIGATPHFSYFAVFAPMATAVTAARAYPNPWKPGSGGRFDSALVTFDGLPADALIQVFTIGGDLVKELRVTAADSGVKTWNGLNTAGSKAASGIYLVLVRSDGKTKTFKLGVER